MGRQRDIVLSPSVLVIFRRSSATSSTRPGIMGKVQISSQAGCETRRLWQGRTQDSEATVAMKLRPLMRSASCSNYQQSQPRAYARGSKRAANLALKPNRDGSDASASLESCLVFSTRTSLAFQRPNFPIWNTPATAEGYEYYCTAMNFLSRCHQTLPTKGCSWFNLCNIAQNLPASSCGTNP